MERNKVIIITSKDDAHADHLIRTANEDNHLKDRTIRINTEDFALNTTVIFNGESFDIALKDSGRKFLSHEVKSVWFRRPKDITQADDLTEAYKVFTINQWTAFLRGFYFSTHNNAKWYNPLPSIHQARIKLPQLVLAHELGIRTPATCVTNDPVEARNFFNRYGSICTKSLDEPNFAADGHIFPMYTQRVESIDDFLDESSIRIAPIFLQEFITKSCDVRVTIVDDFFFAVSIFSQEMEEAETDFRAVAPHLLRHESLQFPAELTAKVKKFVSKQGLRFSAMDFCIDKATGEFIFLENNCNGQWLWLEHQCGVPITNAMMRSLYW